jgi:putative membrane protein
MSEDLISQERFSLMERKLYNGIATPAMIATIILGAWLASYNWSYFISSSWFQVKILLVITLIFYHCLCARYMNQLKYNKHDRSHIFYRWFNEFPVLILIGVIILVVVKPSS